MPAIALPDPVIGNNIANARHARGITRIELARACGVDQATIWRIENGLTEPRIDTVRKIAVGLDVDYVELLP